MCELTCEGGTFWRDIYKRRSEPTKFNGFVFYRRRDEQELADKQAKRLADFAVRELRAAVASDKTVFAAFEHVAFAIEYRRPQIRAALADAYRTGDNAELGRIVAEEMRLELQEKAEEAADEEFSELEFAEMRALSRDGSVA